MSLRLPTCSARSPPSAKMSMAPRARASALHRQCLCLRPDRHLCHRGRCHRCHGYMGHGRHIRRHMRRHRRHGRRCVAAGRCCAFGAGLGCGIVPSPAESWDVVASSWARVHRGELGGKASSASLVAQTQRMAPASQPSLDQLLEAKGVAVPPWAPVKPFSPVETLSVGVDS